MFMNNELIFTIFVLLVHKLGSQNLTLTIDDLLNGTSVILPNNTQMLEELNIINIHNFSMRQLDPLKKITQINKLNIENCTFRSLSFLKNVEVVEELNLTNNPMLFSIYWFLIKLKSLKSIRLHANKKLCISHYYLDNLREKKKKHFAKLLDNNTFYACTGHCSFGLGPYKNLSYALEQAENCTRIQGNLEIVNITRSDFYQLWSKLKNVVAIYDGGLIVENNTFLENLNFLSKLWIIDTNNNELLEQIPKAAGLIFRNNTKFRADSFHNVYITTTLRKRIFLDRKSMEQLLRSKYNITPTTTTTTTSERTTTTARGRTITIIVMPQFSSTERPTTVVLKNSHVFFGGVAGVSLIIMTLYLIVLLCCIAKKRNQINKDQGSRAAFYAQISTFTKALQPKPIEITNESMVSPTSTT